MAETYLDRGARLEREVQPYTPGTTLEEAAKRARVAPARIAKLSSNESPLGPSPRAVTALRRGARRAHAYPSSDAPELSAAIARYAHVRPAQVVVGGGSSTLMHAIVAAFTTVGGEVISLAPSFTVYAEIAAIQARVSVTVPLRPGDFSLDLMALRAAITPRTQLVFLARPNNPTSTLIPIAELEAVAEMAADVGALVVSDEAYIEFADAPGRESAVTRLEARRWPNIMVTRTFSKAFGLADLRVGYALGTADSARYLRLANVKWPTGALAQAAALAALADRRHLERTLAVVHEGRAWLVRQFERLGFVVAPRPQGNYVMVDVGSQGWTAAEFAAAVFQAARVLIRGDFADRYVRISIGRRAENRRLMAAVERLLARRRRRD